MTPQEKAKFLIIEFYDETKLDFNPIDSVETVNTCIVDDFLRVKRIAIKCAELMKQVNLDYFDYYEDVINCIKLISMEDCFEK